MSLPKFPRCLVTGAGSGLGKELALVLASKKARLWLADIHLESAQQTAEACMKLGASEAHAISCDVRNKENWKELGQQIEKVAQGLDFLANNAGVAVAGDFLKIPDEDWKWGVETNLWSVIYGCQTFLPMMLTQKKGYVLNIGSAAGLFSPPKMSPYNVTKAAVVALSETLHTEYKSRGIGISVACPTFFHTPIVANGRVHDETLARLGKIMTHRIQGNASDIAKACIEGTLKKELYILPSWDAKLLWRFKRATPNQFTQALQWILKKNETIHRVD